MSDMRLDVLKNLKTAEAEIEKLEGRVVRLRKASEHLTAAFKAEQTVRMEAEAENEKLWAKVEKLETGALETSTTINLGGVILHGTENKILAVKKWRDELEAKIEKLEGRVVRLRGYNNDLKAHNNDLRARVKGQQTLEKKALFDESCEWFKDKHIITVEELEELEEIRSNAIGIGPGDTVLYGTARDCEIASEWLATHTFDDEMIDAAWAFATDPGEPQEEKCLMCICDALERLGIFRCGRCDRSPGKQYEWGKGDEQQPCANCNGHGWVIGEDQEGS
jgi:hypothetical protein